MGFLHFTRTDLTCSFDDGTYGVGDCVDYQFRMAIGPITFSTIAFIIFGKPKNPIPLFMIVPYALGRIATGYTDDVDVQYLIATPLLCLGYGWGFVTYTENSFRRAIYLIFGCIALVLVLDFLFLISTDTIDDGQQQQLYSTSAQMIPLMTAVFASLHSLAMNRNFLWFFGLLWGISGPVLIATFIGNHYDRFDSLTLLSGPRLWYSDSFITLPLVFVGQLVEAMCSRDCNTSKKNK